ncbi:MAG: hypothetical protein AAGD96_09035 [Chloroflexota bacterium]
MNTLKIKKVILIVWMTVAFSLGTGIVGTQLGLETTPAAYACGGAGQGGGC